MKREDLKALGLEDGVIDSIMALNGKAIETHKTAAQTAQAELETIKAQLTEAGKQIENFKNMKTQAEVDAAVNEWKTKAEQAQIEADKKVEEFKFNNDLEKELKETYKVKDPADVIPHLQKDKIKREDGKFIGLDEQINPLKSSKDYLFTDVAIPPRIVQGGNNQSVMSDPQLEAMRKGAGLTSPK